MQSRGSGRISDSMNRPSQSTTVGRGSGVAGSYTCAQAGSPSTGDVVRSQRSARRSEEHTSELQSLMRISYAVFCLKKKHNTNTKTHKSIQDVPTNLASTISYIIITTS